MNNRAANNRGPTVLLILLILKVESESEYGIIRPFLILMGMFKIILVKCGEMWGFETIYDYESPNKITEQNHRTKLDQSKNKNIVIPFAVHIIFTYNIFIVI